MSIDVQGTYCKEFGVLRPRWGDTICEKILIDLYIRITYHFHLPVVHLDNLL
jgi:hypothetical protein